MSSENDSKYKHKLQKVEGKLAKLSEESDEHANLLLKKQKYVKKLGLDKDKASKEEISNAPIDKSGVSILLFYAYVEPAWTPAQHSEALKWAESTLESLDCTGRLRIAREGFNGTLTGPYDGLREFAERLRNYHNGYFKHMNNEDDFKFNDNLPIGQKFPKLKVFPVRELVNYGIGIDGAPSVNNGGVHLDPEDYHKKLHESNTVVIDVRNSYEADIGRFAPTNGAEYIDPKMRVSTEFPLWVKDNFEKIKDKQVLMYCTGGIRCERASALVRSFGHDRVFQLKGGIHNYLEEYADRGGGCWVGENYTFDKRFSHGAKKKEGCSDAENAQSPTAVTEIQSPPVAEVISQCAGCGVPWNKYRGKKRCPVCGVPLLLCFDCVKCNAEKTKGAKCNLCKEDEIMKRKPFNKLEHKIAAIGECGNDEDAEDVEFEARKSNMKRGIAALRQQFVCGVCEEGFRSRNALFRHIKEQGHANRKSKKQKH